MVLWGPQKRVITPAIRETMGQLNSALTRSVWGGGLFTTPKYDPPSLPQRRRKRRRKSNTTPTLKLHPQCLTPSYLATFLGPTKTRTFTALARDLSLGTFPCPRDIVYPRRIETCARPGDLRPVREACRALKNMQTKFPLLAGLYCAPISALRDP